MTKRFTLMGPALRPLISGLKHAALTMALATAVLATAACEGEVTEVNPPGATSGTDGTSAADGTSSTDGTSGKDGTTGATGTTGTDGTTGPCVAKCSGKDCGPDGCGGFCGFCPRGAQCQSDGTCDAIECTPKCDGKVCGPDGCGGQCGTCAVEGEACNGAGICTDGGTSGCVPDCVEKECGDDGCGNECGKCAAGQTCSSSNVCEIDNSACGPIDEVGECQQSNSIAVSCKAGQLVAQLCDPAKGLICGYNMAKNKYDCVKDGCTQQCDGKNCGSDGCGGSCGQCKPNETCNANGQCQTGNACTPNCSGKQCGPDGCGGQCGICSEGLSCSQGSCIDPVGCAPTCSNKQCGSDSCGGSCGTCKPDETCTVGKCLQSGCTPSCVGKQCGPDGCGGGCGVCADTQVCDGQGHCVITGTGECGSLTYEGECSSDKTTVTWCEGGKVKTQACPALGENLVCSWITNQETYWCVNTCLAACANKECGDNGCGSSCGTCDDGKTCNGDGICITEGGGGDCGDISFEGLCQGVTLKFCDAGELQTVGCGEFGLSCGWIPGQNWYGCVDGGDCTPNCLLSNGDPKQCGDDGCGNQCDVCDDGFGCEAGVCIEGGGSDECGDIDFAGTCEATTLKYCASGVLYTVDCAGNGQTCGFDEAGEWYNCQAGPMSTSACGTVSAKGVCVDGTLKSCDGNAVTSKTCTASQTCLFDPGANASQGAYVCETDPGCPDCGMTMRCQIDGSCGCDGIDQVGHCEDNEVVYCLSDGLHFIDCDVSSNVCGLDGSGLFDCIDP